MLMLTNQITEHLNIVQHMTENNRLAYKLMTKRMITEHCTIIHNSKYKIYLT